MSDARQSLFADLEMEASMSICSICLKPFDTAKKHMCDGCGTTFSGNPPAKDRATEESDEAVRSQ